MAKFFIDFESWVLDAKDADEAWDKASKYLLSGKVPNVANVDKTDDDLGSRGKEDELYDYIQLDVVKKGE